MQAGAPVTLELNPPVELATAVGDGCRAVPEGVMVVRLPPFSKDTTGPIVEDELVAGAVEDVISGTKYNQSLDLQKRAVTMDDGPVGVEDVGDVEIEDDVMEVEGVCCRGKTTARAMLLDKAMEIRARFTRTRIVGVCFQKVVDSEIWRESREMETSEAEGAS